MERAFEIQNMNAGHSGHCKNLSRKDESKLHLKTEFQLQTAHQKQCSIQRQIPLLIFLTVNLQ